VLEQLAEDFLQNLHTSHDRLGIWLDGRKTVRKYLQPFILRGLLLPAIRGANWRGIYSTVCFFVTRHSLVERRVRYLFYCMFVCLFSQRFLSNPRADSRHILHAGVAWVGTCLPPFWGSATPVGGKKRENDMGVVSFVHRPAHILV